MPFTRVTLLLATLYWAFRPMTPQVSLITARSMYSQYIPCGEVCNTTLIELSRGQKDLQLRQALQCIHKQDACLYCGMQGCVGLGQQPQPKQLF